MSIKENDVEGYLISLAYRLKVLCDDIENLTPVLDCLASDTNARLSKTNRRQCEHELRCFVMGAVCSCKNMAKLLQEARKGEKDEAKVSIELEAENSRLRGRIAGYKELLEEARKK